MLGDLGNIIFIATFLIFSGYLMYEKMPVDFFGWFITLFIPLVFAVTAGLTLALLTGTLPDRGGDLDYGPGTSSDIIRDRR